ncbi:hypothetical protein EI53_02113 [Fusobacterium naviforme]|nr:hypothetical protein F7P78_10935 [Fusobacterium naviforme]PSL08852.1 hypothetical protein EI53_02113 [Fusobacterium naviforme]STO26933.1 Uncharacterised protein [Fusobacterium naviforme]
MAKEKEFNKIMHKITAGLTGDQKADLAYLVEQTEAYKDHELGQEIVRACGRLIYDLIPEEKRDQLDKAISNDGAGTESLLEEVRFNIYKKDFDKALSLIEPLVLKMNEALPFQDDQVSEYRLFDESFEEILYRFRYRPEKELRRAPMPLTEIYTLYGSLLIDLKRIPESQRALKQALYWNPVSFRINSEYTETFKIAGDLDNFFRHTVDAFRIAFRAPNIARCYRNLGYYFVEKELYSEAIACYLLSMQFEKDSKQVQSELYYIHAKTDGKIAQPSMEDARKYAKQYGFPIGADNDVIGLSFSYGKHFFEEKNAPAARYFLEIAYGLTDDDDVKKMIDALLDDSQA